MVARRFFVPGSYVDALPRRQRPALIGFMSVLLAASWRDERLYGSALVVDAARASLAETCAISLSSVRRYERELEAVGVLRIVDTTGHSRVLEIIEPGLCGELDRADRAAPRQQQRPGDRPARRSQVVMGDHLRWSPMTTSNDSLPILSERGERSRLGRTSASDQAPQAVAQSGQSDPEIPAQVAKAIVDQVRRRLGDAAPAGTDVRPWRLGRRQVADVEGRIAKRMAVLQGAGAASMAITLTKRDVERVLTYSLKADKPAAHFHRTIERGDWQSSVPKGSKAAQVAACGPSAEMPVQDLGSRQGPPPSRKKPVTTADRQRLDRALDAAGAQRKHRELASRVTTSEQATAVAVRLEAIALQREVVASC